MTNKDTLCLLKECDSGTKMAVSSIDEILDKTEEPKLKQLLSETKDHHEKLGNEIHTLLIKQGSKDQEPAPMAKGMSWLKTNMKMGMDKSDATIADLITDGCNMGVKSLGRYLNEYQAADERSKDIAKKLIALEAQLATDLRVFL